MSRFEDTLQRDLNAIADRATPSPDAWARIQSRIDDQEPDQETEIIMLVENTTIRRRWPLVAAAAAVVALAIGAIALVNRDDGVELPADVPTPTVAPAPDGQTTDGLATPLPSQGATLAAGRYSSDRMGVPIAFEIPAEGAAQWTVNINNPLAVAIGTDAGFVGFQRIGSFYDADQAQSPTFTGLGSIPPDDIDGWIEANGIIVEGSAETTVDGRAAQFRQVRVPDGYGDGLCPPEVQPCVRLNSVSADLIDENPRDGSELDGPFANAYWFIEMDGYEPLGIWAFAHDGDMAGWLDEIAPIIDNISLGEPAPAIEGGTALISTFGQGTGNGELPEAGEQVAPGTYTSDAIGTPVTVDIQDGQTGPWTLVSNDQNGIQLISDDTGREFMAIGRVGSWFDAVESRTEGTRGLGSIPADGVDTWIAVNDVIVVDSAEVTVGGRDAKYRLIRLDTTPGATADFCPAGETPCLWAASGSADLVGADSTPVPFGRDRVQALWSVDMGEFEPVFIFAAANLDDDGPWFADVVQPIVDSIVFGAPAPVIEGGTARVPSRVTVSAQYSGVRTDGEVLADGTSSITYVGTSEGTLTGEIAGTGTVTAADGDCGGTDEYTFTGTIEGVGTGSLTYLSEWVSIGCAAGGADVTNTVTAGTGDFDGITGTGTTTVETSDKVGADDTVTGTNTFELVIPRSG